MAKREHLLAKVEKAYAEVKAAEQEELHNALVDVINKHNASIENTWFALRSIQLDLEMARYKEKMGVVKLSEKLPLKPIEPKQE